MSPRLLELLGVGGLFRGFRYLIAEGQDVVVGRSRRCEVSVTRTEAYRSLGAALLRRNRGFRKMSRRHFRIRFETSGRVIVTDLSTNGLTLDRRQISTAEIDWGDFTDHPVVLRFGEGECLRLGHPESKKRKAPLSDRGQLTS